MSQISSQNDSFQRKASLILLIGLGVFLLSMGARLVYINTTMSEKLHAHAERQYQSRSTIPAQRGMILDASGRYVALSRQMPDVFIDPSLTKNIESLAQDVGARINVPVQDIIQRVKERPRSRYIVLASGVDEPTADSVRAMHNSAVGLQDRSVRYYPLGSSMAQVIGFVGKDATGLEGIELLYDQHLRGRDGKRATIRDARRRALKRESDEYRAPIDGGHIVLTLDAEIQRITDEALLAAVEKLEAQSAVAIVMSPRTGEILAMSNVPTYDANNARNVDPAIRRNRCLTDPTEPGSAIKPAITCGALAGGFVSITEKINCYNGYHSFGGYKVKDTRPSASLDLKGIITRSSNIGMATIGHRMGNQVLYDTLCSFGFGQKTGLRCIGECEGLVRPVRKWTNFSTTAVSFGYEISVTPLQLVNAYAAIVNGGFLLKPKLVKQLLSSDGQIIQSFEQPEVIRRVVSQDVADYVSRELLVSVVQNGGGKKAQIGRYRVMGKTGTAKLSYTDRAGYEPGAYASTFVGAAPVSNPSIVVVVTIRRPNPSINFYGSQTAAPVAGEIIDATLSYMNVKPDRNTMLTGL